MIELHTGPAIAYFLLYSWYIRAVKEDICPTLVIRDDILWLRWLEVHRLLTHCCSFRCNCVNSGGLEHGILGIGTIFIQHCLATAGCNLLKTSIDVGCEALHRDCDGAATCKRAFFGIRRRGTRSVEFIFE